MPVRDELRHRTAVNVEGDQAHRQIAVKSIGAASNRPSSHHEDRRIRRDFLGQSDEALDVLDGDAAGREQHFQQERLETPRLSPRDEACRSGGNDLVLRQDAVLEIDQDRMGADEAEVPGLCIGTVRVAARTSVWGVDQGTSAARAGEERDDLVESQEWARR